MATTQSATAQGKTEPISVRFTAVDRRRLDAYALARGYSIGEVIRTSVRAILDSANVIDPGAPEILPDARKSA